MDYFPRLIILLLSGVAGGVSVTSALHFKVEPEDTTVEEGGPARLDCTASSAFGPVTIQWRSEDGQPINFIGDVYRSQLANGSLYVTSVTSDNAETTGKYQCLASVDDVGAIVSGAAEIKVATLPEFQEEPRDTMVYLGQIAYLVCSLPMIERGRVRVHWLKDEHPLMIDDSRMSLMPSGALEIDDVRTQDVGAYRCNVSGYGQSRLSRKAQLSLLTSDLDQAPTAPIFIAKPHQQVAIEGSTITLECAANGYPKPTILWLKDGITVDLAALDSRYREVAASSLMITDVMEEDNGSYQCRAENRVETLDAVAEVVVQVPPRFVKRPEDKVANKNQDLEFECEISGKPEPRVTWLKNGERITLSEYWQLVNSNNLRINGLLAIDAGIFQCIGVNPAGSVQAAARLTINIPKKNSSKTTTPKSAMKKKKLSHQRLYNNTWQHPSTLLGHTSAPYTPHPLSMDDPSDLHREIDDPIPLYDPASHFLDDTDGPDVAEGSVPSAPRNLSVVIVKSRFVTLRWEEPENTNGDALTYNLYYKQEGAQRERVLSTGHKQLDAVIRSLQPGVTYEFRVVAHNLRGAGASSDTLKVTTHSEADVPSPPLNLKGMATSPSSIKLSWQEPTVLNGRISKYIITYMEGEGEGEKVRETTSTTHELIDLIPYTEYSIWVHAVNENGPGASTGEISIKTFSAPPSEPPHNVTLEAASSTSIIIRWEPPLEGRNGIITGYKIRYRKQDRRYPSDTITTEGNQRLYSLTGLERHSVYHIRIAALNAKGIGPWTEWLPIETYENDLDESAVPSAPSALKWEVMANSILLRWSPPKDDGIKVRGYIVGWGKGFPDGYTQRLDGKQRFFSLENLEPLSEYVITLRATNEAGEGPPIYDNVRTTEKSVPESLAPLIPPVGLKAIVLSANTVVLYWTDNSLSKSQYVTDNRYYLVRYGPYHPGSFNSKYKYFNASDLNCMINDLKPNTQYEFTVKTRKGKRESPWSMLVLNQTQEAEPTTSPRDLVVQGSEDRPSSVILKWQPPKQPNGQIIGYILSYSTDNTKRDRDWLVEGIVGNRTEYVVKGLRPGTSYYFKMQARNLKGYGPFSSTVMFKTLPSNGMDYYDDLHDGDGKGLSGVFIYIIVGCTIVLLTGIAIVVVFVCCKRNPDSPDRKKSYMKDPAQKTNIKPPDLWIHHDQMELKALEKSSMNGEASTSGVVSNTLPRSGNSDYSQENVTVNSSSLDKRTYVPSYMGSMDEKCSTLSRQHSRGKPKLITLPVDGGPMTHLATATPLVNGSMSQPTIHNTCTDGSGSRPTYPRTVAQYSLSRAHITLEPTPESSPDSCSMPSTYDQLNSLTYGSSGPTYTANSNYAPGHYGGREQSSNGPGSTGTGVSGGTGGVSSTGTDTGSVKRLQGHPLKSFSVPAPPPQSAPSTPQQKHGMSQVTVRPSVSGSPYKKQLGSTSQLTKNRLASVSSASHTPEEIERLKPSYSTEELNQEMANLEGLMKDLNAITASEFEC
ncbi:neogenin isoform X2 [Diachasmimorpha longicaudata]|uniref:neogenin isoform X2 n=1 Tax=Diachasmimorpha longicaudata TaxID=58733 RepID=UPI0030B88E1F